MRCAARGLQLRARFWAERVFLDTVYDCVRCGERWFLEGEVFFGHGTDNAWDEAVRIVCHAIGESPDADRSLLNRRVSPAEGARILELFARRVEERIPAAYLTGEAWFCRLPFNVDPRVLIPRSPFGELIANRFAPWLRAEPRRILDLCCGSGCMGIAAALSFPGAEIVLSDVSPGALEVALSNVARHRVGGRVSIRHSNGFEALAGERFDLIMCNPPYVDSFEYATLPEEYAREPALALVSGKDGLEFT